MTNETFVFTRIVDRRLTRTAGFNKIAKNRIGYDIPPASSGIKHDKNKSLGSGVKMQEKGRVKEYNTYTVSLSLSLLLFELSACARAYYPKYVIENKGEFI